MVENSLMTYISVFVKQFLKSYRLLSLNKISGKINASNLWKAWCSVSHRQTHPYKGFHSPGIENASVVCIFASPNAPLSRISPFENRKCKRHKKRNQINNTIVKNTEENTFLTTTPYKHLIKLSAITKG